MKTKKIMGFAIAMLAVLSVSLAKAQCPGIKNDLTCAVRVRFTEYTSAGLICNGPVVVVVPALTTIPYACNSTCAYIEAELIQAPVGNPVTPVSAFNGGPSGPTPYPGPSTGIPPGSCGSTSAEIWFDSAGGPNNWFEINR